MKLRVSILDRYTMFLQTLTHYIESRMHDLEVRSTTSKLYELIQTLAIEDIDILIMDVNVSDREAVEMIEDIKDQFSEVKIVVMSAYKEPSFVRKVMRKGADAYLYKGNDINELQLALYELNRGRSYLGEGVRVSPQSRSKEKENSLPFAEDSFAMRQSLTSREREVLSNIYQGKTSRQIGADLYISHQTVMVHKKNIMKKLGVHNTPSLLKMAKEQELV